MSLRTPALALAGVLALTGLAACGSDDGGSSSSSTSGTTAATTTQAAAPVSGSTTVKMSEFKFDPASFTAAAGSLKITAPNIGNAVHELVLARTNDAPDALPTNSAGEVVESKLDTVGEIADVASGKTKSNSFDLKPGKYVYFCNIPGHYKAGMYGSLDVK